MSKLTNWTKYQIGLDEARRVWNGTSSFASNADLAARVAALALEVGAITLNAYRAYHGDTIHAPQKPIEIQIANIEIYKYLWHVFAQYVERFASPNPGNAANNVQLPN